jgi:hypothetical protein
MKCKAQGGRKKGKMFIIHLFGNDVKKESITACNRNGKTIFWETLKEFKQRLKKNDEKHLCCKKCVQILENYERR